MPNNGARWRGWETTIREGRPEPMSGTDRELVGLVPQLKIVADRVEEQGTPWATHVAAPMIRGALANISRLLTERDEAQERTLLLQDKINALEEARHQAWAAHDNAHADWERDHDRWAKAERERDEMEKVLRGAVEHRHAGIVNCLSTSECVYGAIAVRALAHKGSTEQADGARGAAK